MDSEFLKISKERGFLYQSTDLEGLDHALSNQKVWAYQGFDLTAPSLHIGNLVGIMWLRHFEKLGHRPIILLGGATTLIGDPSDKDTQRPLLDLDIVQKNTESIRKIFKTYLKDPLIVNNIEWLAELSYLDFLRDFGRYFSINKMVNFEFVKSRLTQQKPLSFLEFNYMILQAYDFLVLNERYGCILEFGGSDQWANILNGVELVHKVKHKTVYGLTVPLLTNTAGVKMGKTVNGAVWLDSSMCSPYDFWQYWRNIDDQDVEKCLKIFTELSMDDIARLSKLKGSEVNEAKKILADHATTLLHGESSLVGIHKTVENIFDKSQVGDLSSLPRFEFTNNVIRLIDLLVQTKLCKSNGEAKKAVQGGGVRINDEKIDDPFQEITINENFTLSLGKKQHVLVVKK